MLKRISGLFLVLFHLSLSGQTLNSRDKVYLDLNFSMAYEFENGGIFNGQFRQELNTVANRISANLFTPLHRSTNYLAYHHPLSEKWYVGPHLKLNALKGLRSIGGGAQLLHLGYVNKKWELIKEFNFGYYRDRQLSGTAQWDFLYYQTSWWIGLAYRPQRMEGKLRLSASYWGGIFTTADPTWRLIYKERWFDFAYFQCDVKYRFSDNWAIGGFYRKELKFFPSANAGYTALNLHNDSFGLEATALFLSKKEGQDRLLWFY